MRDNSRLHIPFHLKTITILMIAIVIVTGISLSSLYLTKSYCNSTTTRTGSLKDTSFQIDNTTFSHHTASVNGIQLHYVIGGHGDPVVLLHGWTETWYEWHKVMPALAKNYTVIAPRS